MKIKELNGRKLKKDLEAVLVRKTYHNKHVDGSGNFGFIIRRGNNGQYWYRLYGDYNKRGEIIRLYFSDYASYYRQNLTNILFTENETLQYKTIVEKVKDMIDVVENKHLKEVE